jgi:preprotein translocase subunit SecD
MASRKGKTKMKIGIRIWILLISIALALLLIKPSFDTGAEITFLPQDSIYYEEGLRVGDIIKSIDGHKVTSFADYGNIIGSKFPTEEKIKITINTESSELIFFTNQTPEIVANDLPKSNIQTGLDLRGGARALIKPEKNLNSNELNDLISITRNRLNVYGLTDLTVRPVSDLAGNSFILVEIAGSSPKELEDLISKQGKFEAKIGNETVFVGGNKDITYVARTGEQTGIGSCDGHPDAGYLCSFQFAITLSESAAKNHADITDRLEINSSNPQYLDKPLDLYLDDVLVDSLQISKGLKGRINTQISIQGSGTGSTNDEAVEDAETNMKQLQTVLITGSLPFKLEIVKLDTISPLLGEKFIKTIILAGLAAILGVAVLVFLRYRKIKLSLAVLLTSFSEVLIILGVASIIKWNIDLPSIAGIIAAIGTGVDQQIIILDESRISKEYTLKERIKKALFIIVGAYFTTLVAMLPLIWVGAGLLKGFAYTTIIGISIGVLITRPAFAEIVKKILKD